VSTSTAPGPAAPATPAAQAVAPAVRAGEQLPLGDDALEVVTGRRPRPEPAAPVSSDWISTQASERPEPAQSAGSEPEASPAEPPAPETLFDAPDPEPALAAAPDPGPDAVTQDADESATAEEPRTPRPRKAAKGRARASVPSWDEIMFGSPRGE
jgi:hypothetical protein